MKKRSLSFIIILFVGAWFIIPSVAYSLFIGKDNAKPAQPEFSPTRLIVKLKPEVDRKITWGQVPRSGNHGHSPIRQPAL